jgi:hypothetical protein
VSEILRAPLAALHPEHTGQDTAQHTEKRRGLAGFRVTCRHLALALEKRSRILLCPSDPQQSPSIRQFSVGSAPRLPRKAFESSKFFPMGADNLKVCAMEFFHNIYQQVM